MNSACPAPLSSDRLVRAYLTAKRHVLDGGYGDEIAWQHAAGDIPLTAARFTEEAAWVVLSAGMRESVVRSVFTRLAAAAGRDSVDGMCEEIGQWLGEPVAVVDIVLWRWSVLHARNCREPCDGLPHRAQGREGADAGRSRG